MKKIISSSLLIICSILISVINCSVFAADTSVIEYSDGIFDYELYQNSDGVNCATVTYCSSTENSVAVPDNVVWNGNSYKVAKIDGYSFSFATPVNVSLSEGIDTIGENAFYECTTIENIQIPESIVNIESWAFGDCNSLSSISVPGRNVQIGEWAFCDCTALLDADLSGVVSLEANAFNDCSSLTSVTMSADMKSIAAGAFFGCYNLTDIYFDGTQSEWSAVQIDADNEYLEKATIHFTSTSPSTDDFLNGDITGDGNINLYDAIDICKYIMGMRTLTAEEEAMADFDENGVVDLYDAIGIAKKLLE